MAKEVGTCYESVHCGPCGWGREGVRWPPLGLAGGGKPRRVKECF